MNGQSTTPYQDMGFYWAALEPLRGAELYQAAQQNSTTSFRIIIRYQAVAPGDRFIFSSKVSPPRSFVVDSCYREQEQNEYLMINATELKKA